MRLDHIIRGIAIIDRRGRFEGEVAGIKSDSRQVQKNDLFVAIRGLSHDGHEYIETALKQGAMGVMAEQWPENLDPADYDDRNIVLVPNTRKALGLASANFYGQPSRKLHIAGITGTNGKTTVSYVLESIVRAASKKVGVIGTVDARFDGQSQASSHTTPGAVELQHKLSQMVEVDTSHVVMEVSSHALDQQRVAGVHFKVVGFTNLSQDHLDYHKSMDTYFEAKARLFSEFLRRSKARGRMAVVNIDDARGSELLERWGGKALKVSINPESDADVVVLKAEYDLDGTKATIRTSKGVWEIQTALVGAHNLSNTMVAVAMALAMGFSKARILRGLSALERVPGRLERVPDAKGRFVFVDYAHSPDALSKVLQSVKEHSQGRLVVVFGCGGDRDQEKRSLMGQAVAKHADIAVVTNDNPRSEEPEKIADMVVEGLKEGGFAAKAGEQLAEKEYLVELDRRSAIRLAIDSLQENDALIVAGKGHENYQIIGDKKHHFDDREEAYRLLAGLPPPPPPEAEELDIEVSEDAIEVSDEVIEAAEEKAAAAAEAEAEAPAVEVDDLVEEAAPAVAKADPEPEEAKAEEAKAEVEAKEEAPAEVEAKDEAPAEPEAKEAEEAKPEEAKAEEAAEAVEEVKEVSADSSDAPEAKAEAAAEKEKKDD